MVDHRISDQDLAALASSGVVGIRLNLLDAPPAKYRTADWQALFRRIAALGWLIEVQAESHDLADALDCIWPSGAPLVVDHFGRPDSERGLQDPGFEALIERATERRIWVKLSAPYRSSNGSLQSFAQCLLDRFGAAHLLWGSDWPWTQHEAAMSFDRSFGWLQEWVPDLGVRQKILGETPARLFKFA